MRPTLYHVAQVEPGRLSTMAKPRGGDWLDEEMTALRACGVDVLVSALTLPELLDTGLTGEDAAARDAGLGFVAIPIPDRGVPDPPQVLPALRRLAERLRGGAHVVTHCRFGVGRASLLAASLLVLNGTAPDTAWHRIAQARGLAVPDTDEQRRWVTTLLAHVRA